MNRRLAVVALALLAAAPAARADSPLVGSPHIGSFEIGVGSYRPNIDAAFTGTGTATAPPADPYKTIFGGGRGWMLRLGVARSLFTEYGSLDLGIRTGWFRDEGKGLLQGGGVSGDKTTFNIVPTSLTLTYRFDLFAEKVPFVPYGRVALERYNWWVTDGAGKWSKEGATNGWSMTGGLAVLLDFFDPMLARELDTDTGINHTYLFFDVTKSKVDDFGSKKSWDLSDKSLSLAGGLMFVF